MGKAFRAHAPAGHALEAIVANRCRRIDALRDIVIIDDVPLLRRVAPDARKAIGL